MTIKETRIKRALVAVYDKTGIVPFAQALVNEFGIEIISTGGTARHLKQAGIPVTMVEEVTSFPEMLDGRVKTLHPKVHAGILADRDNLQHLATLRDHNIKPIDMVVVSLYPFEQTVARPDCTFEQAIEMIDIGGPCLLRAAAKNHKHVAVVPGRDYFETVLKELRESGDLHPTTRTMLAVKVFSTTCQYDSQVGKYLTDRFLSDLAPAAAAKGTEFSSPEPHTGPDTPFQTFFLKRRTRLRYGENPHARAALFVPDGNTPDEHPGEASLPTARTCSESEISFNNYVDGDSALALIKELTRAKLSPYAVAFIKHTNACGCAIGNDPIDTYRRAYLGDPVAAAGGVLCMNFPVTLKVAETVMNSFATWGRNAGAAFFKLDVWIAPLFDDDAIKLITTPTEKRKWGSECRLLATGPMDTPADRAQLDFKKIVGGVLIQDRDLVGLNEDQWKVVTRRQPTPLEWSQLRFAWLVCKHTKSNAITLCRDGMLLGNGAGQMSRVKSCDLAIQLSRENGHGDKLKGAVAAGDAFFPVPDGPKKLIDAGIQAIIHPGGSNRDQETIDLCDSSGAAMIITGTRHFKH